MTSGKNKKRQNVTIHVFENLLSRESKKLMCRCILADFDVFVQIIMVASMIENVNAVHIFLLENPKNNIYSD